MCRSNASPTTAGWHRQLDFRTRAAHFFSPRKDHTYEQKIPKSPYVNEDNVYMFAGEKFGLGLEIDYRNSLILHYQPDEGKADVVLEFKEDPMKEGPFR